MKKKLLFIVISFALVILAIAMYFYSHRNDESDLLTLYGNVDVRQVNIAFRVSGQVESLLFEEGDLVHKGELMTTLNTTPYISKSKEAEAQLASVVAKLKNAEILLERRQALIESSSVSQEELDDALSSRDSLRAEKATSEAALAVALDELSYTKAFAPNEGIVLTRIREPGSVVNPSDPIYTLSLTTPIWIRAYVSEPDLGRIRYGMDAEVFTDASQDRIYKGKIGFISPVAEFTPKTVETTELRTDLVYRLRIYIDQPDSLLKQGMPVTVRLQLCEKRDE